MTCRIITALSVLGFLLWGGVPPARAGRPEMARAYALYSSGHYKAAAEKLIPLAWHGDAGAQGLLGFLYEYGKGVPQSYVAAAAWYSCAAEQGEATAQYLLGMLYDKGRGLPQDVVLSQKWLILATARASRRERDAFTGIRSAVAAKMSAAQLALAQRLALEWAPGASPPFGTTCWPGTASAGSIGSMVGACSAFPGASGGIPSEGCAR